MFRGDFFRVEKKRFMVSYATAQSVKFFIKVIGI